jgi:beta-lactamase regulating signal transducer with metallopeptidase domain
MSELLRLILANALAAGLLAVAAWAVSRGTRRQSLVHGLWVLALVKLVTPPIVPLPLLPEWTMPSLGLPEGPAVVVVEDDAAAEPRATDPGSTAFGSLASTSQPFPLVTNTAPLPQPQVTESPPPRPASEAASVAPSVVPWPSAAPTSASGVPWERLDLVLLAWVGLLAGALAVASLAGLRIRRFRRLLRLGVPASPSLAEGVAELAERVGLRKAPPVLLLPARVPPMLWPGRGGPVLLMPADLLPELTDEERDTLLVHELAHVRRRDHWVRLLELAATVLFWWYPVTWWVRRALRRAEERCCDEWVLRVMPNSAGAYADGLLKSLDLVAGEPDPLPVGASGAGPVRDLEARLKEILMSTRPTPTLAAPVRLALAAVALLGLAVFPTQAQSPESEASLESPPEVAPEPPAAPAAPEIADATSPPPPPEAPAPSAAAAVAAPAIPERAVPAVPAPPEAPAPVVAPIPEPRPVVAPVPHVPRVAVAAPAPVVAPRDESAEDEAARRELEEEHRKLEAQRAALRQREFEITRERLAREVRAQQEQMRAEAARLRAAGEAERAALVEKQARMAFERRELQQREIALEQARVAEQMKREQALRSTADELHTLERQGQTPEAAQLRERLTQLEQEHVRRSLEIEQERIALRREAMELEYRAQLAEMELAEETARRGHDEAVAHLEQNRERQQWAQALQRRELEARTAAQALHAKRLEARALDAEGQHHEAEAARAETERMRQEVESLQRGIREERLLQSTSELEHQMESQLEALRHILTEGASDATEVQKRIDRIEAALAALRPTE